MRRTPSTSSIVTSNPANIFVTTRGAAKVLDFGIALAMRESRDDLLTATLDDQGRLTGTGATVGTVAYMSPEQIRGEPVDHRSALFSVGLVLYEMAAGRPAFNGSTLPRLLEAVLQGTPTPVSAISPRVPPDLVRIIGKALEKDRSLRYQSAAEMRTARLTGGSALRVW